MTQGVNVPRRVGRDAPARDRCHRAPPAPSFAAMTTGDPERGSARGAPVWLFAGAAAANAALLFTVEPLVSRQLLPLLGGTPSVWNTCLMAFQALLLSGYLYAHLLGRVRGVARQGAAHLGLLAVAALTLPVAVPARGLPDGVPPAAWVLALLVAGVGLPFTVLAAGAPLLQRWYAGAARDGRATAAKPYALYAASNAGSFVALLAYPFLVEPRLGLAAQARAWAVGYVALGVALAGCVAAAARGSRAAHPVPAGTQAPSRPASRAGWPARLRWTFLAFVPSALLLAVTRYLTTDVAPVPLLWVVPLALYLLTFVLAFAERVRVPDDVRDPAFALVTPVLAILVALGASTPLWAVGGAHLLAFTVVALTCHQQLADRRPGVDRLTEYYLWIAAGGLLGGVFDAVVAPAVFDGLHEYPLAVALGALAWWLGGPPAEPAPRGPRPTGVGADRAIARRLRARLVERVPRAPRPGWWAAADAPVRGLAAAVVVGGLMYAAAARLPLLPGARGAVPASLAGGASAVLAFSLRGRRDRFALAVAALLVGGLAGQRARAAGVLARARSFYGAYTVRSSSAYHHLQHGNTLHGAQDVRPAGRRTPLTYYHAAGPLGALFARVPRLAEGAPPRRVAVVGLGTGTMACWGRAGERWTFYEVDPLMVRIARDPRLFTYLRDCPPRSDVVLGDARLSLGRAARGEYDLIVLDAFSSDAIPTHLLTAEAVAVYLDRLAPGGVLAVHVSNRYLRLAPVVARLARGAGAVAAEGRDLSGASARDPFLTSSAWVAVARDAPALGALASAPGWRPLAAPPGGRAWTDDYTDVLAAVRWR
jgi:hypothetical protein